MNQNTSLTSLECGGNALTSLDVSKNISLTSLDCSYNDLTSLDVSQHTSLVKLDCSYNELASLDVSQNTSLTSLDCDGNGLTSLDVSQNLSLAELSCIGNKLTSLDVKQNTSLTTLRCGGNQLTKIELGQQLNLTYLNCTENKLTSLDVTQIPNLEQLFCFENALTVLDISQNVNLWNFYCGNNQLTSLDVSQNPKLLWPGWSGNQYTIQLTDNAFDLTTLPGSFDVSKTSKWSGGTVEGTILTADAEAERITYTYACGGRYSGTFTLLIERTEHTHSTTVVAGYGATCTQPGQKTYYICECGKWFADAEAAQEITDPASVVIPALGHDMSEATCTAPATCQRDGCGHTEGEALGHDMSDATCTAPATCQRDGCDHTEGEALGHTPSGWQSNSREHWKLCQVCGQELEQTRQAHTDEDADGSCDICGRKLPQADPSSPSTGDGFPMLALIALMVLSSLALAAVIKRRLAL